MNQKLKKFFTLTRKANGGFTLVELIVVIAILAILAGVAVPAYSGYVAKAERAGDEVQLKAVNEAFASACLMNGENHIGRSDATATITDGKATVAVANIEGFADAFSKLYEDGEFKVITKLAYNPALGMFVDLNSFMNSGVGSIVVSYGGGFITLGAEELNKLKDTTFIEAFGGADGLLEKVNEVTDFAAYLIGSSDALNAALLNNDEFLKHAASAMGIDPNDPDYLVKLDAKAQEMAKKMVENNPGMYEEDAYKKVLANAAVIHAAKNATDESVMTKDEITNLLKNPGATTTITGNLSSGDSSKALAQAALAYGMYTAYAHSTGNQELMDKTGIADVMLGLNEPGFQEWMGTAQAQKDLDGYLASLSMINNSSNDKNAVSDLLQNGFNNDDLKDIFNNALGE